MHKCGIEVLHNVWGRLHSHRRRPDFSAAEMRGGGERYFAQSDTRSTSDVVYRMRVKEATPDRIMLEMENVTAVRVLFIPI